MTFTFFKRRKLTQSAYLGNAFGQCGDDFYLVKTTGGVLVSFANLFHFFAGIGWGILIFSETHGPVIWLAVAILVGALSLKAMDSLKKPERSWITC